MQTPVNEPNVIPADESEAFRVLISKVGRKSPRIPANLLARQVMTCVPASEWPVRVDGLEALLRRIESAKNDALVIESKPEAGRVLGPYITKSKKSGTRPYRLVLRAIEPLEGSCDCPDFLRNSLGICKHLVAVLEHLFARPKLLKLAFKEQDRLATEAREGLRWNPIRPLLGRGDWLERVEWFSPEVPGARRSERRARLLGSFETNGDGPSVLIDARFGSPETRLALVEDLLGVVAKIPAGLDHDPALEMLLTLERERIKRLLKSSLDQDETASASKGLKRALYPYQREGVERFLSLGRLLLADDMGLGKTAQAIASCDILFRSKRVKRGLLIVPASLKPQWAREWAVFSELPITVVEGPPADRAKLYREQTSGFLIVNYEQLLRDLEGMSAWKPDIVVLDEAQRIKNWATKTALSVKKLSPTYRLVLTGTPMENRIDELASVVEWVDDTALEPKWRLPSLHSTRADGKREIVGARNLDTLRERLRGCMVRRVRREVLDQLPPRTDIRVPVEMTSEQLDRHDDLNQPILALMQISNVRPLTQSEFLRLMSLLTTQRVISNGLCQLNFEDAWPSLQSREPDEIQLQGLFAPKLIELRQLIRNLVLEQNRKVVVFSQWRRMLLLAQWAVKDILAERNLRSAFFSGNEGQRRRTQNLVEFHDDPDHRILFATDAGGVGLNLQHASNCVINIELPWNPAVLEQRIGRVYRLGQKSPIDVYNLVCEEGIESRIAGLVGSKQAFFQGLFDGDSDAIKFDQTGSFMARMRRLYELPKLAISETPAVEGEPAADGSDDHIDDGSGDPFADVIEAAEESGDVSPPAAAAAPVEIEVEPEPAPTPAPIPLPIPSPAPALAALDSRTEPSPPSSTVPAVSSSAASRDSVAPPLDVRRVFEQLRFQRRPDGNVVIEAPPEAALTLSALFEGMAALLAATASAGSPEASQDSSRSTD